MGNREDEKKDSPTQGLSLDDLIRQYREVETKKEDESKGLSDVGTEISSFILQHYDRVLLLERNETSGESAYRLLKAEGYNVEWETDREAALQILESERFTTLVVSEGFSADGLLIRDRLKEKGIQVNLRIIKDFGTAILGHEETDSMKKIRRSLYKIIEFLFRFLESFHPSMVGHSKEVSRLAREVATRMELLPDHVDGVTVCAYLHELSELHSHYRPYWERSNSIFGDLQIDLPQWSAMELTESMQYPYPIAETLKHLRERFDGNGYPDGLEGEEIPIASRIIAPIDVYLNMISGIEGDFIMSKGEAIDQLIIDSGGAFDPIIVGCLIEILKKELSEGEGSEYREKILMVDTSGEEDLLKIQLREEGYKVFYANNIQTAMNLLATEEPFMVISDIDLEGNDGFQLLELIRKNKDYAELPFILLSARSESSFVTKGIRAGADDFLPRPIATDVFLAKISRYISRAKGKTTTLAERRGVSGSLRDLGILEIIQVLAAGMKSAMIIVEYGNQEAKVALKDGRIVYADLGEEEGKDAFYSLMTWEDGNFTIHMNVFAPKENIFIQNDMLLLESFRRLDEARRGKTS